MYIGIGFFVAILITLLFILNVQQQWVYVALDTPEKQFGYSMLWLVAFVMVIMIWPFAILGGFMFSVYYLMKYKE